MRRYSGIFGRLQESDERDPPQSYRRQKGLVSISAPKFDGIAKRGQVSTGIERMLKESMPVCVNYVYDIVTGYERYICSYESEGKRQSTQPIFPGESMLTKLKRGRSVGRKTVNYFFTLSGHVAIVTLYIPRTVTVRHNFYANIVWKGSTIPPLKHHNLSSPQRVITHAAPRTAEFLTTLRVVLMSHLSHCPI